MVINIMKWTINLKKKWSSCRWFDTPWRNGHHVAGDIFKRIQCKSSYSLQWRHNERDSVSNHQPYDCLFNCLFRRRSKKTSKLRATGLCMGNSPVTSEFPTQRASNAENISIWWRHHVHWLAMVYSSTVLIQRNPQCACPLPNFKNQNSHSLF